MSDDAHVVTTDPADQEPQAPLTPAARRALAEAAARRAVRDREAAFPAEHGGRGGLDPVRYDDWEIAGRAVDF